MPAQAQTEAPSLKEDLLQWLGVLAGPIAWALQLQINYMLVPRACATGRELPLHLVTFGALLLALAGAALAWRNGKRLPRGQTDEGEPVATRSRFMSISGLVLSLAFALVIVALEIPTWVLGPCE